LKFSFTKTSISFTKECFSLTQIYRFYMSSAINLITTLQERDSPKRSYLKIWLTLHLPQIEIEPRPIQRVSFTAMHMSAKCIY